MTIGSVRPTPEQELLLLAALLEGPGAVAAFESWAARVKFDLLDQGSYRILPALHANLRTRGVTHPLMSRLQSVSRAAWYRNQLLRHRGADVVRSLESAGLETLLLKGAALVARGYVDVGARPMSDVDILVRRRDANAAMDTLLAVGWEPWPKISRRALAAGLATRHAMAFRNEGAEIDLHWHVFFRDHDVPADEKFWGASEPVEFGGVATRVLGPADQLLHVIVHGGRWNALPPIRWIADSLAVIRGAPRLDWERLVETARARRAVLAAHAGLAWLDGAFPDSVPPAALDALAALPASRLERADYALGVRPPDLRGIVRRVLVDYAFLAPGDTPALRRVAGFPAFLRDRWLLESFAEMPGYAARSLLRRVCGSWPP